jgi:hypothetical protein
MPKVLSIRGDFPIAREACFLTRRNCLDDGTEYRTPEQAAPLYRWEIDLGGRSDAELRELEDSFLALGGPYESFVFLDPLANLLKWSEDFSQAVWTKSHPGDLTVVAGLADPLGGNGGRTLINYGPVANSISQQLDASPAGRQFTASIWLRSGTPAPVQLVLHDGGAESHSLAILPGSSWRRYWLTAGFGAEAGSKTVFRFDVPALGTLEAFGAQLMALPSPAPYSRTTTVSGFHPHCRFANDVFSHRLAAFGQNDLRLSIVEFA